MRSVKQWLKTARMTKGSSGLVFSRNCPRELLVEMSQYEKHEPGKGSAPRAGWSPIFLCWLARWTMTLFRNPTPSKEIPPISRRRQQRIREIQDLFDSGLKVSEISELYRDFRATGASMTKKTVKPSTGPSPKRWIRRKSWGGKSEVTSRRSGWNGEPIERPPTLL